MPKPFYRRSCLHLHSSSAQECCFTRVPPLNLKTRASHPLQFVLNHLLSHFLSHLQLSHFFSVFASGGDCNVDVSELLKDRQARC